MLCMLIYFQKLNMSFECCECWFTFKNEIYLKIHIVKEHEPWIAIWLLGHSEWKNWKKLTPPKSSIFGIYHLHWTFWWWVDKWLECFCSTSPISGAECGGGRRGSRLGGSTVLRGFAWRGHSPGRTVWDVPRSLPAQSFPWGNQCFGNALKDQD